jgi:hypothetical protein
MHVVFNTADTGDAFGGNNEGSLFALRDIRAPKMDDSVLDGHVTGRNFGPSLLPKLFQQLLAKSLVFRLGAAWQGIYRHRERTDEVCPADYADEPPIPQNRYPSVASVVAICALPFTGYHD